MWLHAFTPSRGIRFRQAHGKPMDVAGLAAGCVIELVDAGLAEKNSLPAARLFGQARKNHRRRVPKRVTARKKFAKFLRETAYLATGFTLVTVGA